MEINLTPEEIAICHKFAKEVTDSTLDKYKERNQKDPRVIQKQHLMGKMAEFAVRGYLNDELGMGCSLPDVAVYNKSHKRFDVDLSCMLGPIGVKSFASDSRFPPSWLYSAEDKLLINCSPIELVAFCEVHLSDATVKLHGITHLKPLLKYLEHPIKKDLLGIKKVLYLSKLPKELLWAPKFLTV